MADLKTVAGYKFRPTAVQIAASIYLAFFLFTLLCPNFVQSHIGLNRQLTDDILVEMILLICGYSMFKSGRKLWAGFFLLVAIVQGLAIFGHL